jgi:hypothetical protein
MDEDLYYLKSVCLDAARRSVLSRVLERADAPKRS